MIKLLINCLPDSVLESVNAFLLAELDRRKLIIWAEDVSALKPENEHLALRRATLTACCTAVLSNWVAIKEN